MDKCCLCNGTGRMVDPNISEGMLGTFSQREVQTFCTIPCNCKEISNGEDGLSSDADE